MKNLTRILNFNSDDETFNHIKDTFRDKIATYSWYVNWDKVNDNIKEIEVSLNILNSLIGKPDFVNELTMLILKYPEIVKTFPTLIATRECEFEVLTNIEDLVSKRFNFKKKKYTHEEAGDLACFLRDCGFADLVVKKSIKNFVDYVCGVEVGLDSNGRKNRSGTMMENICEAIIKKHCDTNKHSYITQATKTKISNNWNIDIQMDKSDRIIESALKSRGKQFPAFHPVRHFSP